jgi:hypothetical protein
VTLSWLFTLKKSKWRKWSSSGVKNFISTFVKAFKNIVHSDLSGESGHKNLKWINKNKIKV